MAEIVLSLVSTAFLALFALATLVNTAGWRLDLRFRPAFIIVIGNLPLAASKTPPFSASGSGQGAWSRRGRKAQQATPNPRLRTPQAAISRGHASRAIAVRCEDTAVANKLSPRETEIFILLAQGRTRTLIQAEPALAENTAKTHIAHIYAKLGIGNRQEMMNLVLGTTKEDGGAARPPLLHNEKVTI